MSDRTDARTRAFVRLQEEAAIRKAVDAANDAATVDGLRSRVADLETQVATQQAAITAVVQAPDARTKDAAVQKLAELVDVGAVAVEAPSPK